MKGEAKDGVRRYGQLDALIAQVRPKTLVEIGAHRAVRARRMSALALQYQDTVHYTGFDIFEDGDADFQQAVLNDKGPPSEERAAGRLRVLTMRYPHGFSWELIKGDTRKTLAGKRLVADLVFIDGDHRLETIRSDYAAVRGSRCVVFDDYFLPGENGELPDLDRYGPNRIIDEIDGAEVLPVTDRAKQGWLSALAVVMRQG